MTNEGKLTFIPGQDGQRGVIVVNQDQNPRVSLERYIIWYYFQYSLY